MQAEEEEEEAIEEKRYNFTTTSRPSSVVSFQREQGSCAPWRGVGARGLPPRRSSLLYSSSTAVLLRESWKIKNNQHEEMVHV